jgi:hypothetical protein
MKNVTVQVDDETNAHLVETVTIEHLSDLGEGVKDVVEDFVEMNEGVVFPPVSIQVTEQKTGSEK